VSALVAGLSLVMGGSAAYGLSRYPFPGPGAVLNFILSLRMITPASLVLPLCLMMERLQLASTLAAAALAVGFQ
jgi:ABC-type glycerol-3-phosphate transport system permease component